MFAAFRYQSGGCDYTIACGQDFTILPEDITTMEEAQAYVLGENEYGDPNMSSLYEINKLVIYEISNSLKIDLVAMRKKDEEEKAKLKAKKDKEDRQKRYEELKKEFE
jgi:hypothetical protein